MSLLADADALFVEESYERALEAYSAAIAGASPPDTREPLARRAATLLKLGRCGEAAADAAAAAALGLDTPALHLHAGLAQEGLGQPAAALASLARADALLAAEGRPGAHAALASQLAAATARCSDALALQREAPEGDASVATSPSAGVAAVLRRATSGSSCDVSEVADALAAVTASSPSSAASAGSPPPAAAPRPRYDWYQSPSHVTVTVWLRDVVPEASSVFATGHELATSFTRADGTLHELRMRLHGSVCTHEPCGVAYRPTKVEVRLPKAAADMWPALERPAAGAPAHARPAAAAVPAAAPSAGGGGELPAPLAASRPKKDWGALERAACAEDAEVPPDGEEALQGLFRSIYADADEDTRKAMVKSFQLSGGTVLSTDWKDVAKRDFADVKPPDGQEFRKW